MLFESEYYCPECDEGIDVPEPRISRRPFKPTRREFVSAVGAAAVVASAAPASVADDAAPANRIFKPAETLVRELHETLSPEQKKEFVLPWDHQRGGGKLSRLGTFNSAFNRKRLGQHFTKAQQDLIKRAVQAMLSDNEAWERISRYGKWDGSRSFEGCGCAIFGEPSDGKKFSWVFSGHHLTLRCDGNSQPGAAFGGPVYYGHSANGYSDRNVYYYQTKQVQSIYDALDAKQQAKAVAQRNPGDRERGIQFPKPGTPKPGIGFSELADDQRKLLENVMRLLLEPFRKEDVDEVMQIVKANGGMQKIHLAFYKDGRSTDENVRWHFWRLEGPGFIWNYRVLPHVHCYVNIVENA